MNLDNKLILITGASSGIGEAVTKEFLNFNCKIAIIARNKEKLAKLHSLDPKKVFPFPCDVTDSIKVTETYNRIKSSLGIPEIVILNAGIANQTNIEYLNAEASINVINTNLSANIFWMAKLLPDFIQRKSGIIAGVSSLGDNRAYSLSSVYCATKSAFTNYLEGISLEAKKYNIKICTIRPGFVKSNITDKNKFDMPMLMEAENAAKIIVSGIKKEKRYIQFPFRMVFFTRLIGLIPNVLFEKLFHKISPEK